MGDEEIRRRLYEANQNVIKCAYDTYLSYKDIHTSMEDRFKNNNTATKIELYKSANDEMSGQIKFYSQLITGDAFLDNTVRFLIQQITEAKQRVYKLTAEAVGRIDDPDFLNDINI